MILRLHTFWKSFCSIRNGWFRSFALFATLIFSSQLAWGQLDCANAITLTNNSSISGDTRNASNNVSQYVNGGVPNLTGPEIVYAIDWNGGVLSLKITGGLEIFLLDECEDVIAGFITAKATSDEIEELIIDLDPRRYYIVVEGRNGAAGEFTLSVGVPSNLDCLEAQTIIIQDEDPIKVLPNESTIGKTNNQDKYVIEDGSFVFNSWTGPESIYIIAWPGGEMNLKLDVQGGVDLGMFLLRDCDATTAFRWKLGDEAIKEDVSFQEAGFYYLVVDAKDGAAGNYELTVSKTIEKLDCANPVPFVLDQANTGNTSTDGVNNVEVYPSTGDERDFDFFTGKEVLYEVNWPGGEMIVDYQRANDDLYHIILDSCDPINRIDFSNNTGQNTVGDLPQGTYYIVVDGFGGASGDYSLTIAQPAPDFAISDIIIDDDSNQSSGNDNEQADAAETIELILLLENIGAKTANNIVATLSTNDPDIRITDKEEKYFSINAGEIGRPEFDFDFEIAPDAPSKNVAFTLDITSDEGNWTLTFEVPIVEAPVGGSPVLVFDAYLIDDDNTTSSGNNNDIVEAGEIIELPVALKNIGDAIASNVQAILSTTDPNITITDNDLEWGSLGIGASKLRFDFIFEVDANAPSKDVTFTLQITANEGTWTETFSVPIIGTTIQAPNLVLGRRDIYDSKDGRSDGNDDRQVNPGETIRLVVRLQNTGDAAANNLQTILSSNDPDITISENETTRSIIDVGQTEPMFDFFFSVNENAPPKNAPFTIVTTSDEGSWTHEFTLEIFPKPEPAGTCDDPIELAIGEEYEGNTTDGQSLFEVYNNDNRFMHTGPEVVHKVEWTGGFMDVLMDVEAGIDLDVMVLKSCDPTDFVGVSNRAFPAERSTQGFVTALLDPGTYYIIVDGWKGATGDYKLTVSELASCSSPLALAFGQRSHNHDHTFCGAHVNPREVAYLRQFEQEFQRFQQSPRLQNRAVMQFPITAHVIRRSDGSGGLPNADAALKQAVDNLNTAFRPANVSFFVCGTNVIDSDLYYDFQKGMDYQLTQEHDVSNTINVYIPGSINTEFCRPLSGGFAKFPAPGNLDLIVINQGPFMNNIFVHEMGHYFNLYHTFEDVFGKELVNGSNCSEAGDLLCDTPADPGLRGVVDENCTYTGNERDANGDPYDPPIKNIMSYTLPECLQEFTPGQYDRIEFAARNLRSYLSCGNANPGDPSFPAPDYVPSGFTIDGQTSLSVARGQRVLGKILVKNIGTANGTAFTRGKYYYSTDTKLDLDQDIFFNEANDIYAIDAGEEEGEREKFIIPQQAQLGTGYILYWVDADEAIDESNEDNNLSFVTINVSEAPTSLTSNFSLDENEICEGEEITFNSAEFGSNVVLDQSSSENDGTLQNAGVDPLVSSSSTTLGTALQLDGDNDKVVIQHGILNGVTNLTLEARLLYQSANENSRIFDFNNGPSILIALIPSWSNQTEGPHLAIRNGSGSKLDLSVPTPLVDGQWYHIAMVWDADADLAKIYINGDLAAEASTSLSPADLGHIPNNTVGGGSAFGDGEQLKGTLDEVRIWNIARSEADIQANQDQALTGTEDGLILYYNFDQPLTGVSPTYEWAFEGGTPSTSTEANPTVRYDTKGRYDVSLKITSAGNSDTKIKDNLVKVKACDGSDPDFDVLFTFDAETACRNTSIQFRNATKGIATGSSTSNLLVDESSNTNDGGMQNFSSNPYNSHGDLGTALVFDGPDNYVLLPENLTASARQFTFETLYYHESDARWLRIMDFGNDTRRYMFLTPKNGDNDRPRFAISINGSGGNEQRLNAPDGFEQGKWYHIAVVIDGTETTENARMYIDGNLVDEQSFSLNPEFLGDLRNNFIGKSQFSDPTLKGRLDEIRIWEVARSQAEIRSNMAKELIGNENGLLAYYDCNSGSPATYSWSFEGGSPATSAEENPLVTWSSGGTYGVRLTVSQEGVENSTSGTITIDDCIKDAPDWPVDLSGVNHTVIVPEDVFSDIEGTSLKVGDYIGAFYSDNGAERCGGKVRWEGSTTTVIVYGNDPSIDKKGFAEGETFAWRVWQVDSQKEIPVQASYRPRDVVITHLGQYANDGISALQSLATTGLQTLILTPKWNLISSYVQATDSDMASIFSDIQSDIAIVKNVEGKSYIPSVGNNQLGNWAITQAYKVKSTADTELALTISGQQVDPTIPISLSRGWNFMAHLRDVPLSAETVFNRILPNLILVKNIKGEVYIPSEGINNLGNLLPGQGYQVLVSSSITLRFPAASAIAPQEGAIVTRNAVEGPDWPVIETGENHTVILPASLEDGLDGDLVPGDVVGLFYEANGAYHCGGKATWTGENIAISAFGDDAGGEKDGFANGETFTFKIWKNTTGETIDVMADYKQPSSVITHLDSYANDGISSVNSLTISSSTGLQDFASMGIRMYPNPAEGRFWVELPANILANKVNVFNYTGQLVRSISLQAERKMLIELHDQPEGIYIVRIAFEGGVAVAKIQIER